MKKRKTAAYALAALLLVGGTFTGTKALFEDKVDVLSELSISTGDVDLEVVKSETGWVLDRNGNELAEGTKGITDTEGTEGYAEVEHPNVDGTAGTPNKETTTEANFANNLKNGDVLTKTIIVQNVGTLNATNLAIAVNEEAGNEIPNWVNLGDVKITQLNGTEIKSSDIIRPKEKVKVELKLTVNASGKHNDGTGQNSDTQENDVIKLTNAWDLTAEQIKDNE